MILKPLYPYGSVQDLSVIEETNAYCWVDIVVNSADAWVRFEGDGASNLPIRVSPRKRVRRIT